jgi:hypothetical protein
MRPAVAVTATLQALLAVLFALQVPWVTDLWPFAPMTPTAYIFIASIFLAAAAAVGWCLVTGSDRGLVGIALDYIAIMTPLGLMSLAIAIGEADVGAAAIVAMCLGGVVFGGYMLRWSWRRPWRSAMPTPRLVLAAFVVFVVALVLAGSLLVLEVPGIVPWPTSPRLSRIIGFMFLGAAVYFAYGLVDRRWENAGGQLAGFLAYDVVLIVPFVATIVSGEPSYYGTSGEPLRLNLLVYTAVVVSSGLLATYYLFIHRATRLWPRSSGAPTDADGIIAAAAPAGAGPVDPQGHLPAG